MITMEKDKNHEDFKKSSCYKTLIKLKNPKYREFLIYLLEKQEEIKKGE